MVHSPENYPDTSQSIVVSKKPTEVFRIAVTVSETEGDSSLQHLDESVRGCKFTGKDGSYTSDSHCLLKCRISEIYKLCNCVPYYFQDDPGW